MGQMKNTSHKPLTLPEPGRNILRTTRAILDRYLPEVMPPGEVWRLGGGTALAGDWHHRESTDIDIKVPRNTDLNKLHTTDFKAALMAAGSWEPSIQRMVIAHFRKGRLEIFPGETIPDTGATTRLIDGEKTRVQSATQILNGKMQRSLSPPARDVYDFAVAGRYDPKSLTDVVSITDPGWLNATLRSWHDDRQNLTEDVKKTTTGVPQWAQKYWDHPVEYAIAAILDNAYQQVRIEARNGTIQIKGHTKNGERSFQYRDADSLEEGLTRNGIGHILSRSGHTGDNARRAMFRAIQHNETRTIAEAKVRRPDIPIGHTPPEGPQAGQVATGKADELARRQGHEPTKRHR